jgi:phage FluMu protein Com
MAIFRCNKCGHIREVGSDYIGKSVKCPKCDNSSTIHDTVVFLNALIKKFITQTKEVHKLRKELSNESLEETTENFILEDIDIHNTNVLAQKYIQNKGYTNVKLELSKKNQKEIQQLTSFCKTLHDYSFVAKYHYQKKDKNIRLTLQTAPKIREFFNGIWMEWFTFMKLLEFFSNNKINPAFSRNLNITFSINNSYELDFCIECKTGEFRQDIDKYLTLRKQLNIEKNLFVICVFGLSQEQAQGMSSMYDLTFINESNLLDHIQTII